MATETMMPWEIEELASALGLREANAPPLPLCAFCGQFEAAGVTTSGPICTRCMDTTQLEATPR